jgi:hypothetical protein
MKLAPALLLLICLPLMAWPAQFPHPSQSPRSNWRHHTTGKAEYTFTRLRYDSSRGWRGGSWRTDWPKADEQFIYGLRGWVQSRLAISDEPTTVSCDDPELFSYPLIYAVEPGFMDLSTEDAAKLREYLLRGGFLMLDDFWGDEEWDNLMEEMKRVFPDREPVELPVEHPIFNGVFPLKERPQVPHIDTAMAEQYTGRRWGPRRRGSIQEADYRAILDDKGRIMVLFCHNTDLGDGWEREGENEYYFREFSEKKAYPLGINIVFYAMTH